MENRIVKLTEDNNSMLHCACGAEILCDKETGDMPEKCPKCGATLDYSAYVSGATPWVCTDPDCVQYRRQILDAGETVFELAQVNQYGDSLFRVAHGHIYLDRDVDDDEVKQFICEYGWDEETLDSPEFPGLLAEAVLESSATEYDTDGTYSTFEDAAKALGELIGVDVSQYL